MLLIRKNFVNMVHERITQEKINLLKQKCFKQMLHPRPFNAAVKRVPSIEMVREHCNKEEWRVQGYKRASQNESSLFLFLFKKRKEKGKKPKQKQLCSLLL